MGSVLPLMPMLSLPWAKILLSTETRKELSRTYLDLSLYPRPQCALCLLSSDMVHSGPLEFSSPAAVFEALTSVL